ncbi:MAG: glycosyltransferase family 2 protein [Verrucomicrobiae bacterium]|nr:glycosyltransferase family 2 protein [Verrucomicrobiae bacterium]MCP5538791.1 glycosyltransferase family 2 protein [Akkermansiaceae bacterium]MCP5549550.1 glycosyltransferase family 2 protein [Akkermansiaceae bacterium]
MLQGKKVAVVMPGYYAEKTLAKTVAEISREVADHIILSDDCSKDRTVEIAKELGIEVHVNNPNLGYGGNVKQCLQYGLDSGADIIILLHPDYQYTPKLVPAMAGMLLLDDTYDLVLASRTSGRGALSGGMPVWKYLVNFGISNYMDLCLGRRHTEYHTGYRAYSRRLLEDIDFHALSDDFIFDNNLLVAAIDRGYGTCEITCPTKYEDDSSSIRFSKALKYGILCMWISTKQFFRRWDRKFHGEKPRLLAKRDEPASAE